MRYLVNGYGAHMGGIVRVHNAVCDELARRGAVFVANAPRDQKDLSELQIISKQGGSRLKSFVGDVARSLRFQRFDIRVDSAPAFRFFTRAGKHLVIIHDLNFMRPSVHRISWKQRLYRKVLHHWTLRQVDRIIVNSTATLEELREFMPSCVSRAVVLSLPVDEFATQGPRLTIKSRSDSELRILAFGHARNKGVDRLLAVLKVRPAATLTVICPLEKWEQLWRFEATRLGVSDRVRVVFDLTDSELRDEYLSADVFCMISSYEGYGLPVAEALALGVPTVISELPVLADTGRGYAVIAGRGVDETHLVRALDEALARPASHWRSASEELRAWSWREWITRMLEGLV